jgi:beta-lactam-binding protein with PASTA domain
MQPALNLLGAQPETFPAPPYLSTGTERVTYRDGRIELDNGRCRDVSLLVYFTGRRPAKTANCKVNEVDVPNVVGWHLDAARTRLAAQPLTAQVIYKPATAGQRLGVVVRQFPKTGTLSSFGRVTIVLAKPLHGTVPQIVGLRWQMASAKLRRLRLKVTVHSAKGKIGRVVAQDPRAGVAAAPGMKVAVTVGSGG